MAEDNKNPSTLAEDLLVAFDAYIAFYGVFQVLYEGLWELGYDLELEGQTGRGFTLLKR